jgi:hypothetical protein
VFWLLVITLSNSSPIDHGREVMPAIIAGNRPLSVLCDQQVDPRV